MKLVVDSNVVFTFFWKKSVARELFLKQDLELYSPEFALEEISKYSDEIIFKTKTTPEEFNKIKKELLVLVDFIPLKEYADYLQHAAKITPDKDDVDFVALSLKLKCPIWSNDNEIRNQAHFKVLTTKEVIGLFD
ncbi:MAG TPA: PIN domain-containing protein [Candidatus Nanoarchaeia archaeon]|nr:PIN domain-containing protein [Candidatus Nanoarchaeia archaeon]